MKRLWTKIFTGILDDPNMVNLSDSEWRERFDAMVHDPKNIHCEESDRQEYNLQRKRLKKAVFELHPHKCAICGSTENLEIDHIIPLARCGTNDLNNLQILCRTCNRRKWAKI